MTKYLRRRFGLSEKGAKDLIKAMFSCTLTNISFMLPMGVIYFLLQAMVGKYVEKKPQTISIVPYIGISLVLLAIIYGCEYLQYNATFLASYKETANKRITIAERMRKIPLSFFGKRDLADLTTTIMGDCTGLEGAFSHYIPQVFGAVFSVILVGVGLLIFDVKMAISLLWVVPAAFLITIAGKKRQNVMNQKNEAQKLVCADSIQECIDTIREIKANNQEENYLAHVDDKVAALEKMNLKAELNTAAFVVSSQMLLRVGVATMTLMGAYLTSRGEIDFLTFLMFLIAASRVFDPLSISLQNLAAIYACELKVERMREIEEHKVQTGTKKADMTTFDVCFDHVRFAYDEKDENVLKDVSFTARQGEVTALVGPSGGGKSTIARLASRFWDINGGRITIGGTDIASIEPEELLKKFAIVFQDVLLFNNTVMENIRLGRRGATDEEVLEAARLACCDEFIHKLPEGYQTVIGENGSSLSGGERQRISIARALLKNAPIILLDEATASLDVENESKVQKAISSLIKDKTVLVIAHRMRTIASADQIVVLADGKVKERGSHAVLMKRKGLYHRLCVLQRESAKWKVGGSEDTSFRLGEAKTGA